MSHAAEPVTLHVGSATIPSTPGPALDAAIKAANASQAIKGLPDALNPNLLDPAKTTALVAALPTLPAGTQAELAGHQLSLLQEGLGVIVVSPTPPAAFAQPFTIVVEQIQGRHVLAHTTVAASPDLARAQSAQARDALKHAAHEPSSNDTNRKRDAIAVTWMIAARAWRAAAPADPDAQANWTAAQAAYRIHARPSGALPG